MDEMTLSISEKTTIMGSWLVGTLASDALIAMVPAETLGVVGAYVAIAVAYGMVFFATSSIWNLVYVRRHQKVVEELSRPELERRARLYDSVAARCGLSDREREVLELLADGHTRQYVQETLGISNGTAKAHVSHIYQKLGIHKREELFSLLEDEREKDRLG